MESSTPGILAFSEGSEAVETSVVGGKGASLIKLFLAKLPVPDGFIVTTAAFKQYSQTGIPEAFKTELLQAFDKLDATRVAVRSSAISEDSDTASWAGQFDSFMNVQRDNLVQNILDCWDSVKGASDYAETQGLERAELTVAVVVQKMVDSDVAGVAFSVNPLNHDSDEIMIEATYGLGELLVQGMVTPDNYVVSKIDKSTTSHRIAPKKTMMIFQDDETKEVPVDISKQEESCLSEDQLKDLCDLICRIENYYQSPQDIEWGLYQDEFYILQSRPITTI